MTEAIKLAIEKGGYIPGQYVYKDLADDDLHTLSFVPDEVHVLNPLFWQALGKALGWSEETNPAAGNPKLWYGDWKQKAHQYLDLLLTGGDTEKFWKELTKPPKGALT
jgi:hypothetical protein